MDIDFFQSCGCLMDFRNLETHSTLVKRNLDFRWFSANVLHAI